MSRPHTADAVLTNACVALAAEIVTAAILLRGGRLAELGALSTSGGHVGGDNLIPGLVESEYLPVWRASRRTT